MEGLYKLWQRVVVPGAAIGMAALVLVIAVIRAGHTEITYDESFTYLNYVRGMSRAQLPRLFWDAQTNNHMLNTLLIWVVQVVSNSYYNEFLIRLPNLLFYGVYLGLAVYMLLTRAIPFWVYGLLVFTVYVNEFFGLARGYGMATCLVLVAVFFYMRWRALGDKGFYALTLSFAAFALGGAAITYVLVILLAFGVDALLRLLQEKRLWCYLKSQWLALVPVAALCLLMAVYQMLTLRNTGFTPGGATGPLAFYPAFFEGFIGSFTTSATLVRALAPLLLVWFLAGLALFYKKLGQSVFVRPFLINVAVWTLLATFGSAIPLERGYLIFYPVMLLTVWELARWFREGLQGHMAGLPLGAYLPGAAAAATLVLAVAVFFSTVSVHTTRDWADNYGIRDRLYHIYAHRLDAAALATSSENTVYFYRDKIAHTFQYDIFTGQMLQQP